MIALAILGAVIAGGLLWNHPPNKLHGDWMADAVTLDGRDLAWDGQRPHLILEYDVDDLVAHATVGCNTATAGTRYRLGGGFTLDELVSTDIGCDPELLDLESDFFGALQEVDELDLDGDSLVLTGDGVRLEFTRFVL